MVDLQTLVRGNGPAEFLFRRTTRFVREHPFLGAPRRFPFLSPELFNARALGVGAAFSDGFNLVEEQLAGDETVESLLAGALGFHLQAAGTMEQHYTSRSLVDVLAAMAS